MNEKYVNIGTPEDQLIEECAELIQAVMKARRFGYFNTHPETGTTNFDLIKREMDDVVQRLTNYEKMLMMLSYEFHKEKILLDKKSETV